MSAKDMILDFINLIFVLALTAFCVFYFTVGDHFAKFQMIMKAMMPLAFFGIIFLVKIKFSRSDIRKRKKEQNLNITLCLTCMDKLKSDLVVFSLPFIILLISFWADKTINSTDIFQASMAFGIVYLWQKFLFKKEN